jgi:hypothetical protein
VAMLEGNEIGTGTVLEYELVERESVTAPGKMLN